MTREEVRTRLKMLQKQEDASWDGGGVISATKRDIQEELGQMETFREEKKEREAESEE